MVIRDAQRPSCHDRQTKVLPGGRLKLSSLKDRFAPKEGIIYICILQFLLSQVDGYVNIHPGSVCAGIGSFETPYLVFQEKVASYIHLKGTY